MFQPKESKKEIEEGKVVAADGHGHERAAIKNRFRGGHYHNPRIGLKLKRLKLKNRKMTFNFALKSIIQVCEAAKAQRILREQRMRADMETMIRQRLAKEASAAEQKKDQERKTDLEREREQNKLLQAKVLQLQQQIQQLQIKSSGISSGSSSFFATSSSAAPSSSSSSSSAASSSSGYALVMPSLPAEVEKKEAKERDLSCDMVKLKELAQKDNTDAQARLGCNCFYGLQTGKDQAEGEKWLLLAAKKMDSPASSYARAICHEEGIGEFSKDIKKSLVCCKEAASQNYAPAQTWLGVCYEEGKGVDQDNEEALRLYRLAADQGCATARYKLGRSCECDMDVRFHVRDPRNAIYWYKLSAEQGFGAALDALKKLEQQGLLEPSSLTSASSCTL